MVGQFEFPILRIEGFRFRMVSVHEPHKILGEVRVVVESRMRLVLPFVSLWRKEREGYDRPGM